MAKIELVNVCKRLKGDDKPILPSFKIVRNMQSGTLDNYRKRPFSIENMNLDIPDGKTMVILGPTGCGKTTLLRIIAGLIPVDSGEIRYDQVNMENTPPGERRIGMVFQNYALYPHFTSKSNILSYFLFKKKTPELDRIAREKYRKTSELMGVDMAYLLDKKPAHLSGGEKQRVALGRCITRDPALFLLDEPFSNLDQKLREKYRVNLKTLLKHFNITAVYVTHDQQEALILADLIAIMNVGRIEQVGTYENIYENPKSIFVAEFLNLDIDTPAINLICGERVAQELKEMIIGVRPEDVEVFEEKKGDCIMGTIVDMRNIPLRNATILRTRIDTNEVYVRIPLKKGPSVNRRVWLSFRKYHIFDKNSGQRLRSYRNSQSP
ncbi:ABC transporter ATP-binding protein [Candidatus Aerophobetes bacterium]|uniref:ABC transporter ATP-binding protein n=1 Tax=Aerophobetes bacterium TaxID=2030807 RepID=A0A523QL95_UNCAE|nr:MAG: ABC transporter ATP-binding protein [Candidatus Aerophobetes bacterium]